MNEKLWAKIIIVTILTINGIVVHRIALAHLAQREGQRLFDPNRQGEMAKLTFIGAVSSVSWVVPFILGVATEFNFTVDVIEILGCYVWLIIVAWTLMFLLASSLLEGEPRSYSIDIPAEMQAKHRARFGRNPGHWPGDPDPRIGSNPNPIAFSKRDFGADHSSGSTLETLQPCRGEYADQ